MSERLNLDRNELASFLPSHHAIRQFEDLFTTTNETAEIAGDVVIALTNLTQIVDGLASAPAEEDPTQIDADYIDLSKNGSGVTRARRIKWDENDGTVDIGLLNGVTLQVGQEAYFYAKNTSGVTITDGSSVMATGAVGASGKLTIAKAVADGSVKGDYMLGIATQDILNNEFGYVTAFGLVRGINTTGAPYGEVWADGDVLYFNPATPGGLTKVEPAAPNLRAKMAMVVHAGPGGSGSLFVRAKTGETLNGLNDVYAPSPATYGILQWNNTNKRWEHTTIAVGLKYGGDATNYSYFEADGTLVFNGNATVWNDWNLTRDFTPTAGAGVPVRNILVGNIRKDQFAVGDSLQYQSAELLHDWKEGTDMHVHVHWDTGGLNDATVRGVKWEIEYSVCNPIESGVLPYTRTATTTQSAEFVIAANQPDRTEHVSTIYTIPGSTFKIGAQLVIILKRIASVTNPAPVNDPFVISFGVHFEADTVGSRTTTAK